MQKVPCVVAEAGWVDEWYEAGPEERADLIVDALDESGELDQLLEESELSFSRFAENLVEPMLDWNNVPESEAREHTEERLVAMVTDHRERV